LVTSTPEVTMPGIFDLPEVRLDYRLRLPHLCRRKPNIDGQVYRQGEPELRLAIRVRDVDVNSGLLTGEEKQAELSVADDRGSHARTVIDRPK